MKKFFKVIWKWLKGKIKIGVDIDIYVFVNNQWIKVDVWQINEAIEKEKLGIQTGIEKVARVKKGNHPNFDKKDLQNFADIVKESKKA